MSKETRELKKDELEKKEQTEIVDASIFEGVGSTGFELTNAESFKTPFLKILQQLSPELNAKKSDHIPGAQIGQYCNTASKKLYEAVNVIVLSIEHNLLAWKPERGGFVGSYPKHMESEIVARSDGPKKWDKDGNDVNDTMSFFCVNADDPSDLFIVSLSTASLKYAKGWATRLRMLKLNGKPVSVTYAGVWNISTVDEHNDKGDWASIGNTPSFKRFIFPEEFTNVVKPALELLKTAETDYNQMSEANTEQKDESVEY